MALRDEWYKNAIIYCIDVETYADDNGDGIGDFAGLTRRLDYLAGLGVTCLWLMPFYPSPRRDDGYDVTDYCAVDSRLGNMADFTEFVIEAGERGFHIVNELVPNHTSNEHPWFQMARRDPNSPYRDYYVWRTDDPGDTSHEVVFPGEQGSIWTYDEEAKAYYLHHFYDFQPDLNFANPAVRDEFRRIMGLWLQLGVDGFRIDAAPFLIQLTGQTDSGSMKMAHSFLAELEDFARIRKGNAVLLGEADVSISTLSDYFGGGNELKALFNFLLNRYLLLGLVEHSADPIRFGLAELPAVPATGQWVNFLRHHDELSLERLTKSEREKILAAFGPEPEMQIYGRGLRRRLAPMLKGDQKQLRLAYSLLFSLPGTPMIFYGEEIGMGENLDLPGRLSVRGPMQWNAGPNAGFSSAPEDKLVRPVLKEGPFRYEQVNVQAQRSDPDSLLNWISSLIRARRECPEIGIGSWQMLPVETDAVLALRFDLEDSCIIVLNNLSEKPQGLTLALPDKDLAMATDLLADHRYEPLTANDHLVLDGFGFRWLRFDGIY